MRISNTSLHPLLNEVQNLAKSEGLHFFGLAGVDVSGDFKHFQEWISESRHGSMDWMTNHTEIRSNPELLLPGLKTILIFGFPYYLGDRWSRGRPPAAPQIAQYARLRDYHKFIRAKLENLTSVLSRLSGEDHKWRVTVDSAPLLERALAANSGGGFIGKNTCVIHPRKGSFFLLGEILTSWDLPTPAVDPLATRHRPRSDSGGCGTCKRCQIHCPTGALDQDYRIDARKCLSYWTIEHRGSIPLEYWPWIGRYMFGCDICQLVCPYNRGLEATAEAQRLERITPTPDLIDIIMMSQDFYETTFGGTPMTRAKRGGLRRNALIAAAVAGDQRIPNLLNSLEIDDDPVIVETAREVRRYLGQPK